MKNLDKLQEDILDILNYSKEFIDESTCKDNIIQIGRASCRERV